MEFELDNEERIKREKSCWENLTNVKEYFIFKGIYGIQLPKEGRKEVLNKDFEPLTFSLHEGCFIAKLRRLIQL